MSQNFSFIAFVLGELLTKNWCCLYKKACNNARTTLLECVSLSLIILTGRDNYMPHASGFVFSFQI